MFFFSYHPGFRKGSKVLTKPLLLKSAELLEANANTNGMLKKKINLNAKCD